MPPVPPGIREIDPDAEAARLAEVRKARTVASYSFDAFVKAVNEACAKAWDNGHQTVRITLPEGVFPHLATMQNPMTREIIRIERVPMFTEVPQ